MSTFRKRIVSGFLAVLLMLELIPVQGLAASITAASQATESETAEIETVPELQTEAETAEPETLPVETSQPEISSEEISSGEISSEEISSEAIPSETESEASTEAASQESSSEETSSMESSPEESSPIESSPVESSPEESSPMESSPVESAPEETVEWPMEPDMPIGPLEDGNGMVMDEIYGEPGIMLTPVLLQNLRRLSLKAKEVLKPENRIPDTELDGPNVTIYIDGKEYMGGDISIKDRANFSYHVDWKPAASVQNEKWKDGSWFEKTLFRVPGLNLISKIEDTPMLINGIKVGRFSLTYDKRSGVMNYRVVFNKYIQMFEPSSIKGYIRSSGLFDDVNADGPIELGDKTGQLTIEPRPVQPHTPDIPSGTGWKPSDPPAFSDRYYGFGKGVKWSNPEELRDDSQIEWRIVFFEELQKTQREFLDAKTLNEQYVYPSSEGNLIITDTLDVNQAFKYPTSEPEKYGSAPFFLELPVMVVGTGSILNGEGGSLVGDNNYDGNGLIYSVVNGNVFTHIEGRYVDGKEIKDPVKIQEIQDQVRNTPRSWTVTKDPVTRQETLMINAGKLGTNNRAEGITWDDASRAPKWPEARLRENITNCENKIREIEAGEDSPITLLDKRKGSLYNLLNAAASLQVNQDKAADIKAMLTAWDEDYRSWRNNGFISPLAPLEEDNGAGAMELIVPLPDMGLIAALENTVVKANGTLLKNTAEYKNYVTSLGNIRADQRIYLENRLSYADSWNQAKEKYEQTLEFYQQKRVYGFAVKVRSKSVNTTATNYSNNVNFKLDNNDWTADDSTHVEFQHGITGDFSLGDIVIQKADFYYDSDGKLYEDLNGLQDTRKVESQGAGLKGAEFHIYCGENGQSSMPVLDDSNRVFFLDKDASADGKSYRYAHTGNNHSSTGLGDVDRLTVNADGKLIVNGLTGDHLHWLEEITAPEGYYLDRTPVSLNSKIDTVTNVLKPNVSRSVMLYKRDSFTKHAIEGAEFELLKLNADGAMIPVTGFEKKNINGHKTYFKSDFGTELLKTDAEGKLCIHGLDEGSYIIKEKRPAPGYELPSADKSYSFTLSNELPSPAELASGRFDKDYHLLLNTKEQPLENDPGTASLRIQKKNTEGSPLADAGFSIFHFTGTELDWKRNPDNEALWESIDFNSGRYYKTGNVHRKVNIKGQSGAGQFAEVDAAFSGADGELLITDIPLGHYTITEVEAPFEYNRDFTSFYFRVDADSINTEVKLYKNPEHKSSAMTENVIFNHKRLAKLALVKYELKYDQLTGKPDYNAVPDIAGRPVNNGWSYTENVLKAGNKIQGVAGAKYKLFMRRGSSTSGGVRPDPEQLNSSVIIPDKADYDNCIAVGTTGADGVLRLTDMTDIKGQKMQGLNSGTYYMIEVEAPEGYLLDSKPVIFDIDSAVYPSNMKEPAGLVMAAYNEKLSYGLRLAKVDDAPSNNGKKQPLQGAEFCVRETAKEELLQFIYADGKYRLVQPGTAGATTKLVTGADGKLDVIGLSANTSYSFTETKAPRGYMLLKTPVVVNTAVFGKGSLEGNVCYPDKVEIVSNERIKGKAVIRKKDAENSKLLQGAEFSLYEVAAVKIPVDDPEYNPKNPDAFRIKDVFIEKKLTDVNGEAVFDKLEWYKHYFIKETKAPDGYMLDETRYTFTIDSYSFDKDGNPIPLMFIIYNSEGDLGRAKLVKVDAADHNIKLPGAEFYLEKQSKIDAGGEPYWVPYGKGTYSTNKNGEIDFVLPAGEYRLTEVKSPAGYVVDFFKPLYFTIPKTIAGAKPETVMIDEENSRDGVVENRKGEAGLRISKFVENTMLPVESVTFQIGWQYKDIKTNAVSYEPLYFIHEGQNNYVYTSDKSAKGASVNVVTGADGSLYANLPNDLKPEDNGRLASLCFWECEAPDGVIVDKRPHFFTLLNGVARDIRVGNRLKQEILDKLSITVHKQDGESRRPLQGAEYELYWYDSRLGNADEARVLIGSGVTDKDGRLVFDKSNTKAEPGLKPGACYHLVEKKAPEGYVLDKTHHEIILDEKYFDKNMHFTGAEVYLPNYKIRGSAGLKKVDADHPETGLYGAEFELMRYEEEVSRWEHYGDWRYTTDELGELKVNDLPYGTYKLIERAAPLGYILANPAPEISFTIDTDRQYIDLGTIGNKAKDGVRADIVIKKIDKDNVEKNLADAHFQLYELGEDGGYHLRQEHIYVTDALGSFTIKNLPQGSYALKEIKAPEGYELPDQPMTLFGVKETDKLIELVIENAKTGSGGGSSGGGGGPKPPRPVYPGGGGGSSGVIIYPNRPIDPTAPGPGVPVEVIPADPEAPDAPKLPEKPADPGAPADPKVPSDPGKPDMPADRTPKTGDDTNLMLWLSLMMLSAAGIVGIVINSAARKKRKQN